VRASRTSRLAPPVIEPAPHALVSGGFVRTETGIRPIDQVARIGAPVSVLQHDGTFGVLARTFEQHYSGPMVRLVACDGAVHTIEVTPGTLVHLWVDDEAAGPGPHYQNWTRGPGRTKPAREVRRGEYLYAASKYGASRCEVWRAEELSYDGAVFGLDVEPAHTFTVNEIAIGNSR